MSCNCIKDFKYTVHFPDCRTLLYIDLSTWVEVPETYLIEILVPGSSIWKEFLVSANSTTSITALQLIGIDQNLVSGIYCLRTTNCNGDILQYDFLNLCTYECSLANMIASLPICYLAEKGNKTVALYKDLKLYLEAAKAKFDCEWCSNDDVKELLNMFKKLSNNVEDCKCS
jgi:hypothetical protein